MKWILGALILVIISVVILFMAKSANPDDGDK